MTLTGSLTLNFTGTASAPNGTDSFWTNPHSWTIIDGSSATNASGLLTLTNGTYAGVGSFTDILSGNSLLLSFTPSAPATPANFVFNPATDVTLNVLKGGSLTTTTTVLNNGGTTATASLNNTTANLTINGTLTGITGGGSATLTLAPTSTTSYGTTTGSLTLTPNSGGSNIINATVNVGLAGVGANHAFGPALSADMTLTPSLTGLSSRTTRNVDGALGTQASIANSGTFNGAPMVTESWRTATPAEKLDVPVVSDVVQITGTGSTVYVLEMTYNMLDVPSWVTWQQLALGELKGSNWTLAAANDNGGAVTTTKFFGAYNGSDLNLGDYGVFFNANFYGSGQAGGYVWAVLDHSGTFAVIPEPTSVGLLGLGAMALLARRGRKSRR